MAGYTWNSGSGAYLDPAQWTPAEVPLYGSDTVATILAGSATLSDAEPNGITLVLGQSISEPTLRLSNAAFGPAMTLEVNAYASLVLDGYNANYGSIVVDTADGPGFAHLFISNAGFGQLNQYGTVTVTNKAGLEFGGVMNNDGLIDLARGFFNFDNGSLTGTGTIRFSDAYSAMNALAPVGPGQVFALEKGELSVSHYGTFQGTVADFTSSAASLSFGDLAFDAATYAQDGGAERLVLTRDGSVVGDVALADTPDTQYTVTRSSGTTTITPSEIYGDGSIPASILEGTVTIRNAEPNGQAVVLGGIQSASGRPGSNLVLDNAALGPSLLVTVSPTPAGSQYVAITVQGYDTNYGEIDVLPPAGAEPAGGGNDLIVNIDAGSQLNQEGTIKAISPQVPPGLGLASNLSFQGSGTLNNDGLIYVGPGSNASFETGITGSGTITVDGGMAGFSSDAGTQLIDFLGGTLHPGNSGLAATIKDWNSNGVIDFSSSPAAAQIDSVAFSQTSASGGDLQLLSGGGQVGDLHLLGTYATSDFKVALTGPYTTGISVSGHLPGS